MSPDKPVSVIIPTYNRFEWLCETLDSLAQQTWSADLFEALIVDDGSEDDTHRITELNFPFLLRYIRQENQGDAVARNTGARHSRAEMLVFLDDDIVLDPRYLAHLIPVQQEAPGRIVVGTEILWFEESNPLHVNLQPDLPDDQSEGLVELPFVDVCSNNMSIRRDAYLELGMMEALDFPGSSMWCDVDFSYRAHQQGYIFLRATRALCWHRDYARRTLKNHKYRMQESSYRAVRLFQKYPDLLDFIPMFRDKTPVSWAQDPPRLIARKLARRLTSSKPALWALEVIYTGLEKINPNHRMLIPINRWILGGHTFQGYRAGLREFSQPSGYNKIDPPSPSSSKTPSSSR